MDEAADGHVKIILLHNLHIARQKPRVKRTKSLSCLRPRYLYKAFGILLLTCREVHCEKKLVAVHFLAPQAKLNLDLFPASKMNMPSIILLVRNLPYRHHRNHIPSSGRYPGVASISEIFHRVTQKRKHGYGVWSPEPDAVEETS